MKARVCAPNSKTFSMTQTKTTRLLSVLYGPTASNNRDTTKRGMPELPSGPLQREIMDTSQKVRRILQTLYGSETSRTARAKIEGQREWWKSLGRHMARCSCGPAVMVLLASHSANLRTHSYYPMSWSAGLSLCLHGETQLCSCITNTG